MRRNSWLAEDLLASQKDLCSTKVYRMPTTAFRNESKAPSSTAVRTTRTRKAGLSGRGSRRHCTHHILIWTAAGDRTVNGTWCSRPSVCNEMCCLHGLCCHGTEFNRSVNRLGCLNRGWRLGRASVAATTATVDACTRVWLEPFTSPIWPRWPSLRHSFSSPSSFPSSCLHCFLFIFLSLLC